MNKSNTKAIILRRINFEEADRILTVITPDQGKLSLIAKGARRSKSKLAGGLELFCVSDIGYINGKSELKTIVSTRLNRQFTDIASDIDRTMLAYDVLKRIDDATQDSCEGEYFELLEHTLAALADGKVDMVVTKVWFLTRLLQLSGHALNLQSQTNTQPFAEDECYTFDLDSMGFVAARNGQFTPKHIKFLRLLSKVDTPANLLKVEGAGGLAKDLVLVLEQAAKGF